MRIWILRPLSPWIPWYDKMFGAVVRAETADEARAIAASQAQDEGPDAWRDADESSCEELVAEGPEGVVMKDIHSA